MRERSGGAAPARRAAAGRRGSRREGLDERGAVAREEAVCRRRPNDVLLWAFLRALLGILG